MCYIKIYTLYNLWAYQKKIKDEIDLVLKHKLLNMLVKKKKKCGQFKIISGKIFWLKILFLTKKEIN